MEDRSELVEVEFDELLKQSKPGETDQGAILVEIDGDEYWVAKSQIDNVEELMEELDRPAHRKEGLTTMEVPKWLACDNGWIDED